MKLYIVADMEGVTELRMQTNSWSLVANVIGKDANFSPMT